MDIEFEFQGLDDLIKKCEEVSELNTIEKTTEEALKECGDLAYTTVKPMVRQSSDNSKSGRKGSRPPGHAADSIPAPKIKRKKDIIYVVIGWEKTDNSPFFYEKFEEWGTSQRPPFHAFGSASAKLKFQFEKIIISHFEKLLNKAIEG